MKFFTLLAVLITFCFVVLSAEWKPGEPFTDERDGQVYKTVIIEEQVWMAENLNIGKMIPTTKPGYEMADNGVIEKYCWDNDSANCDGSSGKEKLGGFYEWKEVMNYPSPGAPKKDICPKGWRLPNNNDWNALFNRLNGVLAYRYLVEGGSSGFEAKMTGYRCTMTGAFRLSATSEDKRTYYWSADESDANNANLIELGLSSLQGFPFQKSLGLCVRCILESTTAVDDNEEQDFGVTIQGNPVETGIIRINFSGETEDIRISLFNLLGSELLFKHILYSGRNSIELDVSNLSLSSGQYYLIIKTTGKLISKSIIILK